MLQRWVFKVACHGGQGSAQSLSSHACQGNRRDMGVCVPWRDPPPALPLLFAGVQALVRLGPRGRAREGREWRRGYGDVLGKRYHKERTEGEDRGIRDERCIMSIPEGGSVWGEGRERGKRARNKESGIKTECCKNF